MVPGGIALQRLVGRGTSTEAAEGDDDEVTVATAAVSATVSTAGRSSCQQRGAACRQSSMTYAAAVGAPAVHVVSDCYSDTADAAVVASTDPRAHHGLYHSCHPSDVVSSHRRRTVFIISRSTPWSYFCIRRHRVCFSKLIRIIYEMQNSVHIFPVIKYLFENDGRTLYVILLFK